LALAIDASKSFARRRFRLSQARVRSATQAPRQQLKAGSVSSAFDDLDGPLAELHEGITQVGAMVDTVCEEMA
jgi:hypothetical protein